MGPVSNKPLEEKELFSVTRSLASVCYSLKLQNLKKYDIHQQGINKNLQHSLMYILFVRQFWCLPSWSIWVQCRCCLRICRACCPWSPLRTPTSGPGPITPGRASATSLRTVSQSRSVSRTPSLSPPPSVSFRWMSVCQTLSTLLKSDAQVQHNESNPFWCNECCF